MAHFEIVAHRGIHTQACENTIAAFQRAIDLDADAVELDVRLTRDRVLIVYHYFYLEACTSLAGPVFDWAYDDLRNRSNIPTLREVLETIGGRIGLEIEIKGPEPESSEIVGNVLWDFQHLWETIEVTSYEPQLLLDIQQHCPGLATDLLLPRSEDWMRLDVVTYLAIHRARLAHARAVHLHPSQLSPDIVSAVRQHGIEVHAWDVNDEQSLSTVVELDIPRICTDEFQQAFNFRRRLALNK